MSSPGVVVAQGEPLNVKHTRKLLETGQRRCLGGSFPHSIPLESQPVLPL